MVAESWQWKIFVQLVQIEVRNDDENKTDMNNQREMQWKFKKHIM